MLNLMPASQNCDACVKNLSPPCLCRKACYKLLPFPLKVDRVNLSEILVGVKALRRGRQRGHHGCSSPCHGFRKNDPFQPKLSLNISKLVLEGAVSGSSTISRCVPEMLSDLPCTMCSSPSPPPRLQGPSLLRLGIQMMRTKRHRLAFLSPPFTFVHWTTKSQNCLSARSPTLLQPLDDSLQCDNSE